MQYIADEIEQIVSNKFGRKWNLGVSTLIYPQDPVKAIVKILDVELGIRRIELGLGIPLKDNGSIEELIELKESHELSYSPKLAEEAPGLALGRNRLFCVQPRTQFALLM